MAQDDAGGRLNGEALQQRIVQEAALRRLNHAEWLHQFAAALETPPPGMPRGPMTPFKIGAIARLRMAGDYITLLQRDLRDKDREIKAVIAHTKALVEALGGEWKPL